MRIHSLVRWAAVAALALTLTACSSSAATPASSGPVVTIGDAQCGVTVSSTLNVKPTITIPDCATKPNAFAVKTIVAGTGPQVQAGQTIVVKYVGVAWSTKQEFDSSWPNTFTVTNVGGGPVIMGWNIGLTAARVGGRILLEIPPDMGYGPDGQGPIGPNETLLFAVDVISAS